MKAPNRFIYYANPLQWARFFRKSLQSKGFYNFTFKKDGEFDHIWIKVNDGDETQLSVNDTFKLYQGDTLKYRVDDSLKDQLGCHAIIGEEGKNIFQVPSETALTSTFRPSNCTEETTKISGTIIKESFQTVPSKTDMDFFVQVDYEPAKYFNFTIGNASLYFPEGMTIYIDGVEKHIGRTESFVLKENETLKFTKVGGTFPFSAATPYLTAQNSEGAAVNLFKVDDTETLNSTFYCIEQSEDQHGTLIASSFEQGYPSGSSFVLFAEI